MVGMRWGWRGVFPWGQSQWLVCFASKQDVFGWRQRLPPRCHKLSQRVTKVTVIVTTDTQDMAMTSIKVEKLLDSDDFVVTVDVHRTGMKWEPIQTVHLRVAPPRQGEMMM